jgi:RNA polymerase sigma factor (sigma-70 family)
MVQMMNPKNQTETARLIEATREGDEKAFTKLVQMYQNLAYASACSLLKDPDLAQDAVQESFLSVYYKLHKLQSFDSFPAWLNTIVKYACYRIIRKYRDSRNLGEEMATEEPQERSPEQILEEKEKRQYVLDAIHDLPHNLREVIYLFYIEDHSQKEVAGYLGISQSTVNNRLYSARQKLKGRMFEMVKDTLSTRKLPDDFAETVARIVRIQGPVIEAQIKDGGASSLFDSWRQTGMDPKDAPQFTVIQRDVNGRIRLICDDLKSSIKVGSKIAAADPDTKILPSDKNLAEVISELSPSRDTEPKTFETGIKMIDLMCPLPSSGTVGLFGVQGVGRAILVMELYHRLKGGSGKLTVFYFVGQAEAANLKSMIDREPNFPSDAEGPLETAWLVTQHATNPDYLKSTEAIDAGIFFSPLISCRDQYPAIDCLHSSSRLLDAGSVSKDHRKTINRVYDLITRARRLDYDPQFCEYVAIGAYARARQHYQEYLKKERKKLTSEEKTDLSRARKLELFLTQPFYTTESFTNMPGVTVSLKDTIAGCNTILDGEVDDIPTDAFGFAGSLEDIRAKI